MSDNEDKDERSGPKRVFKLASYLPTKVIAGTGTAITGVGTIINSPIVIIGKIIYDHAIPRETTGGKIINAIGSLIGVPGTMLQSAGKTLTAAAPALGDGLTAAVIITGIVNASPTAKDAIVKVGKRITERVNTVKGVVFTA